MEPQLDSDVKKLMNATRVACAGLRNLFSFVSDCRSHDLGEDDFKGGTDSYLAIEAYHTAVELHCAEGLS